MDVERTGGGDPTRTLQLLWRSPGAVPRRGPGRRLTVDAVVTAAVEVADADGAVPTIRRVAERLGVAPMSVYTYVPGKAELVDLMVDAVFATMAHTAVPAGAPWRDRVRAVADDALALHRAHPWLAAVSTLRPPLGPGQLAKYEHELAAFDGTGLDDVTVDDCLTHVLTFVRACAWDAEQARSAARDSGDDVAWWASAGPLLEQVLDPERYPRATRVGAAAGAAHGSAHDPDHAYRFGLERLLDGLAGLVDAP